MRKKVPVLGSNDPVLGDGTGSLRVRHRRAGVRQAGGRPPRRHLWDEKGYVNVGDTDQTHKYDDVYAVGIAVAVDVPGRPGRP